MNFLKGYGVTELPEGYRIDVIRAGLPFYNRGGIWYEVVFSPKMGRSTYYETYMGIYSEARRKYITLRNPYFFEIEGRIAGEASYPRRLYMQVFHKTRGEYQQEYNRHENMSMKKVNDEYSMVEMKPAEEVNAIMERQVADYLKMQGYDGVIFYVNTHEVCSNAGLSYGTFSKPTCCYDISYVYSVRENIQICGDGNLALQVFAFNQ